MEGEVRDLVRRFSGEMRHLERSIEEAYWELATTGSDEIASRLADLEVSYSALFDDPDAFATLTDARGRQLPGTLTREVELLYLAFLEHRAPSDLARKIADLSSSIEARYTEFRAAFGGAAVSDNVLRDTLRTTTDSASGRAAWDASKDVGRHVATDVVELAVLRNEVAHSNGFANYYEQALAVQELDPAALGHVLNRLEELTREPFSARKAELDASLSDRFGITIPELRPWHYGEPFFQELPGSAEQDIEGLFASADPVELGRKTFASLEMPIDDVLKRSDLYERDGKNQHAFEITIDRLTDDVRVLANVRSDLLSADTMLHELGHAAYDRYLDPNLPFLLRTPAHISATEAIAMLMGRLTHNPDWLTEILGADRGLIDRITPALSREQSLGMLIFIRWTLVVIDFERHLYENPRRDDLNQLWWQLVSRYQMLTPPERRDEPDWAAKIHIALYPAYYQNYVLGQLIASQLQTTLEERFGGLVGHPEAGEFLRGQLFAIGAAYPWQETVERLTGRPLDPGDFARQFVH